MSSVESPMTSKVKGRPAARARRPNAKKSAPKVNLADAIGAAAKRCDCAWEGPCKPREAGLQGADLGTGEGENLGEMELESFWLERRAWNFEGTVGMKEWALGPRFYSAEVRTSMAWEGNAQSWRGNAQSTLHDAVS